MNYSFAFVEGESLLMALKDIALSSGRYACLVICVGDSVFAYLTDFKFSAVGHKNFEAGTGETSGQIPAKRRWWQGRANNHDQALCKKRLNPFDDPNVDTIGPQFPAV